MGAWCEVSEDFDLILDLIAHALADEETSTIQVPHHQSVARQKSKLVADFGLMMHLTWARQLLDNREFVLVEGRHPSSDPNHGRDDAGYDSEEEERDLHHRDMYMNVWAQPPLWATTHAGGVRDTPPDHTQLPGRLCEPAP